MSKELEALEDLHIYALGSEEVTDDNEHYNIVQEEYRIIKSALKRNEKLETENAELKERNEKLEKVLQIIKNKNVDLNHFMWFDDCYLYNCAIIDKKEYYRKLTDEEFSLLKEILNDR